MLAPGSRVGPWEIRAFHAAGGMGQVYRATDTRLGRDVAVKVLPAELSDDPKRLARFEREARAASALNHPNIVTIHEFGNDAGVSYLVMEWVVGETLRERLASGPVLPRDLLPLACQMAEGLECAHVAGVLHRDLKPENVMVTHDGRVKLLDFGLAKPLPAGGASGPTLTADTTRHALLGTVGYMSPEQASGRELDARSDQFSLGAILYEMASGRRAFDRGSPVETLAAILHEEPESLDDVAPDTPRFYRWVVARCLAKRPEDRYSTTRDVVLDLRRARDGDGSAPRLRTGRVPLRRPRLMAAIVGAVLAAGVAGAALHAWVTPRTTAPTFQRLTFRRGHIVEARFAPGDQTIVYDAAWEGEPLRVFTTRIGSPESQVLPIEGAGLQSVSGSGELAVALGTRFQWGRVGHWQGTLARVSLSGGAPRPLANDVAQADWSPDGELAVVRVTSSGAVLELPPGTVLYRSERYLEAKVSPAGDLICTSTYTGDRSVQLDVLTRAGALRPLIGGQALINRFAWAPGGREVWFGEPHNTTASIFKAVDVTSGRVREIARMGGFWVLLDVGRDDAVLAKLVSRRFSIVLGREGEADRNLSLFDFSIAVDLSARGDVALIGEFGGDRDNTGKDIMPAMYLRRSDGSPAVRLAEGIPLGLSPDGAWVLTEIRSSSSGLSLVPTGPGSTRVLPRGPISSYAFLQRAAFFPDGRRVVFSASREGEAPRLWSQGTDGAPPEPFGPEGTSNPVVSPDGRLVAVLSRGKEGSEIQVLDATTGLPLAGTPSRRVSDGVSLIRFAEDPSLLWVAQVSDSSAKIQTLSLATGAVRTIREIRPADPAGVFGGIRPVVVSADGRTYVASYSRNLSDLYMIRGLK